VVVLKLLPDIRQGGVDIDIVDLHEPESRLLMGIIERFFRMKFPSEHGQPSAYLIDVEDYEFMLRRLELLEALAKGERALSEERTLPHSQAREKMSKWLR
jgi:hypothetical protein